LREKRDKKIGLKTKKPNEKTMGTSGEKAKSTGLTIAEKGVGCNKKLLKVRLRKTRPGLFMGKEVKNSDQNRVRTITKP